MTSFYILWFFTKFCFFGKSVICAFSPKSDILSVTFSSGEKRFPYPEAFEEHLTLRDADLQKKLIHLSHRQQQEQTQQQLPLWGFFPARRPVRQVGQCALQALRHRHPALHPAGAGAEAEGHPSGRGAGALYRLFLPHQPADPAGGSARSNHKTLPCKLHGRVFALSGSVFGPVSGHVRQALSQS